MNRRTRSLLGTRLPRIEDPDLVMGRGRFVADLQFGGLSAVAFVRSPIPHGRLTKVDASAARGHPGVIAVLTASDLRVPAYHNLVILNSACPRPPLAEDTVRFVGEPIVAVVASTPTAAVDAAALISIDFDPLEAVVEPESALADGAPLQFEQLGTNLVAGRFDTQSGDAALADADVVVRARIRNQRIAVSPMEGNAIAVVPGDDGHGHDLTIHAATQMPHRIAQLVAEVFSLDAKRVRVVAPHVGGAFGGKVGLPAEYAVVIGASRILNRPLSWVQTRTENLIDMHGRGQVQYVELGLSREGMITGLRCRVVADAGSYAGFGGSLSLGATRLMAQGTYRVPKLAYEVAVVVTNTSPMGALRGAGRPEASAMLERIMDIAADELGIDPVDFRRRNLISREDLPTTTLSGARYDSGDYAEALEEAVRSADYAGWRIEQRERIARGDRKVIGIGVASYVEVTAGPSGGSEYSKVAVHADGSATIYAGTSAHGQGHGTAFAMILADRTGIPMNMISLVESDTMVIPRGGGTGGSKSLQLGGNAVLAAAEAVFNRARGLASELLEASPEDIVVTAEGELGVIGTPRRSITWSRLAQAAEAGGRRLEEAVDFKQTSSTFPYGAHVAVVEVDLDTGEARALRHVAIDDCGRIISPLIVAGQQHGGIAQGIAQALFEEVIYSDEGHPLTTSFVDYGIPSAAEMPEIQVSNTETPTPLNSLGAKGIGEAATVGSTPAVHNAVVDALSHLGIRHVDMPCTPEKIWCMVRDAEAGHPPAQWSDPPAVFTSLTRQMRET